MIRVIIVEDEPAIARGLNLLISKNYVNYEVVAICENGKDGLDKILELKPDLVFVDIEMPFLNGLEMIRLCKETLDSIKYIILTGYSEFEYARQAICLGVTEYLLKPITTASLDHIMSTLHLEQQANQRVLLTEYLQQYLTGETSVLTQPSPLENRHITLFFLFLGPVQNNVFNQLLMVSPDFFPSEIQLQELENKYHISILTLNGKHLNERIYALVYSKNSEIPVSKIANDLYSSISPTNTFCNLIISTSLDQDSNIAKNVQEAYLYALFSAPFGNSSISCSAPINQESLYSISDTIKQFCSSLSKTPTRGDLQNLIQSVINYWKRSNVSQHKLTCELHYFVSNIKHTTKEEEISYPYITEIVSNSQSYEELLKSLQYELEQIYHFTDTSVEIPESSLAETVKVWLDSNFTTQITYKIFPDLFGYNEKYISTLFKKAYGMSPNKYVAKLRLDMAKKLMQCNPNILMKDVATLTGFTDAFYFSRAFKASEGISPNQFLKAIRKDDKNL